MNMCTQKQKSLNKEFSGNCSDFLPRMYRVLALAVFLCGVIWSSSTFATNCSVSPYVGKATLNEFFKDQSNQANDPDDFAEIKILDTTLTEAIFGNWRVQICERDAAGNNNDSDGCSGYIQVANFTDKSLPWLVLKDGSIGDYINFKTGFDAVLLDENNYVIDYLTVDSYKGTESVLGCTIPTGQLPYDYATSAPGTSDKFISRIPDGIGEWQGAPAASDPPSEDDTNDEDPYGDPAPVVTVDNVTVSKGETATFSFVLQGAPKSYNVSINFETIDGTAIAGTDYVYTSGTATIPAGSSSTSVSVNTITASSSGVAYFYLYLTSPVNATLANHYPTGTILAPPSGEWHMDEAGWNGSAGEVTDHSGFANHGTGKPKFLSLLYIGPDTTPAFLCNGGQFDGINDYVEIPHNNTLNGSDQLSYMAWINPVSWSGVNQVMAKSVHGGGSGRAQMGIFAESGVLKGRAETVAGRYEVTTTLPPTYTWTHVALVFSGTELRLYINGLLASGTSFSATTLVQNSDPLMISKRVGSDEYYFSGLIDEVLVARNAFPASFINQIYSNYSAGRNWDGASRVCAGAVPPDHIRLEHDGQGLTCAPETITIKACANAVCDTLFTDSVTVDLTSPISGWSTDPITFTGGVTAITLRQTTAQTVNLNAFASSPGETNPARCFIGTTESCAITFYDSGFIFDVPTQIANKTSAAVTITAVKTTDTGETCAPAFSGTRTVSFWSTYVNPATGSNQVSVNGGAVAATNPGTGLDLSFDANAQAQFTVHYPDAGQMQLNARYAGSGDDAGLIMTGNDQFLVKPVGLCVESPDSNADCVTGDHTCSAFKKAGEMFNLVVKAMAWESDTDPDLCSGNSVTPNFRMAAIGLNHSLVAPSGGASGNLGMASFDFVAADNGVKTVNQSVSEVGVFAFGATPPVNGYFGETVAGGASAYIGRFYPADFLISHAVIPACNSTFTYAGLAGSKSGQTFSVAGTITARNSTGVTTANYVGAFAKLTAGEVTAVPQVGGTTLGIFNPAWAVDPVAFVGGVTDFTADAGYVFDMEDSPRSMYLYIQADDGEASGEQNLATTAKDFRLGRLRLQNAYGPEVANISVPLQAEYYDGGVYPDGYYRLNEADTCTTMTLTDHLELRNPQTDSGNWQGGNTTMTVGGGSTVALPINSPLVSGNAGLSFTAPGAGNTGYVDIRTSVAADYPWLTYGWNCDATAPNEACGRVSFGLYQGSRPQIYLQERY